MKTIKLLTQKSGIITIEIDENTDIEKLTQEIIKKHGTFIQI